MAIVIWFFPTIIFIAGIYTLIIGIKQKKGKDIKNGIIFSICPFILFVGFVILPLFFK
ncbi:hypothetical protein D3C72_1565900 [compost metagenome]